MKKIIVLLIAVTTLTTLTACGDDGVNPPPGDDDIDAPPDNPPAFVQVEHLGRPAINEALIITEAFHQGYNATAPTFAGVPTDTLNAVVGEAKVVLRALYLGTCLLNGVAQLTPQTGLHPAGIECHAVGAAVFEADGVTQTAASVTASQAYADAVFGLFIPDVLRVDTAVTSNYETLCGAGASVGLCGGRFVSDDVVDTTYDFLLNGTLSPKNAPFNQFSALVQDGVLFNNAAGAQNTNARVVGDASSAANPQQGHPAVSNGFPYSAAPF